MVTADGRLLTASARENEDLFWGLRGGGGNLGIVTSFEYRHPVGPSVIGGAVFYELGKAPELLKFYRGWTSTMPDELTTMVVFLTAPPEAFVPAELQGKHLVAVALCHVGPVAEGLEAVQLLKDFARPAIDLVGPMPYSALQRMFDATAPHGIRSYWKAQYVADLSEEAASVLGDRANELDSPYSAIHVHHLEGAVNRVNGSATAFPRRDARHIVNFVGMWTEPAMSEREVPRVRQSWQALQPFATSGGYINFMDGDDQKRIASAYGENYERLTEVKAKYDPANLFRLNQNVKPTSMVSADEGNRRTVRAP